MDTDKTAIAPQVYQISDASRLRKSSCNYLRSAVSVSLELLALIVADGIRIFTYSEGSGNIIDSFLRTIRLPPGDLIRDIAWAPPGYCVAREGGANTLAICFEDRLELWISKEKSFALHETYFYGKTIVGILHIIWNEDFLNEIFICTSLLIHKVLLLSLPPSPDVNADVKNTQLQPLPSLNTRHPGGIALSSGTFVTGNAYREAVGAFGFTGCGGGDASQKQRRHVVMERCRAPLSLTPQEAQQCEQIRYHPSATTTISNEYLRNGSSLCILAFEPEARISSPVSSDLLAPSVGAGGGEISLCTGSSGPPFPSSLISVVSSTPSMTVVDEANDGTVGEGSLLSALKSKATDNEGKSRGAFPHSTFSTSIAETLRVGDRDAGDGKSFAYQGPSALEALQSLSSHISCNDSDRMLHESCLLKGEEGSISETKPVNLMATGILCAVRLRRESHVEDKGSIDGPSVQLGATAAASPRPKEMAWLGSTLSLPKSRASARTGAILRPDILAIHPLMSDSHSQSSADGATVALLAVSSTLSDQIIVYRVHMNEVFVHVPCVHVIYFVNSFVLVVLFIGRRQSSVS